MTGVVLLKTVRLARTIAKKVKESIPDSVALIAKLNLDDGVKTGFHVDECVQVAKCLRAMGRLTLLN